MLQILHDYNLQQCVKGATHKSGHTLDWVVSKPDNAIRSCIAIDKGLSDHHLIIVTIDMKVKRHQKSTIRCRRLKKIDMSAFKKDIMDLDLHTVLPMDLAEHVKTFESSMRQILDKHAYEILKNVFVKTESPWYNADVHMAKIAKRMAERRWRKSRLTVDRDIFIKEKNKMKKIIKKAKSDYFQAQITERSKNPRALSHLLSRLLNNPNTPPNVPTVHGKNLAETFGDFFEGKINKIRKQISPSCPGQDPAGKPDCHHRDMSEFPLFQPEELCKIVMQMKPTTCDLDCVPTQLLISCVDVIIPLITDIVNHSLKTGQFPDSLKRAIIRPLLKKPGADASDLTNYRPVSNLSFLSKIIERAVSARLCQYLNAHKLLPTFQSAYRPSYSTETALLRVMNDLNCAVDDGQVALVVLLDLSAAFDTIDHNTMLCRLKDLGVSSTALNWFKNYLTKRTYKVLERGSTSRDYHLSWGVPQGSILGPILYSLYTTPLSTLIENHHIPHHLYADDTMLYMTSSPESALFNQAKLNLEDCCSAIKVWMTNNVLKLNGAKTEVILVGKSANLQKIPDKDITIAGTKIQFSDCVKYLGVHIDSQLTLNQHIRHMTSIAYLQLRRIASIRSCLTKKAASTLVITLVLSLLDYCNSLMAGATQGQLQRLQRLQNIGARIVARPPRTAHVSPILRTLHWLSVQRRIEHKILCLVFKCVSEAAPLYLQTLVKEYTPSRSLRSSSQKLLCVPHRRLSSYGCRSFSSVGPRLWNAIPEHLRKSPKLSCFKKGLKTFLFED